MTTDPGLVLAVVTGLNEYQMRLLNGLGSVLGAHRIPLVVHVIDQDVHEIPVSLANLFRNRRIAGVVACVGALSEQEQQLMEIMGGVDVPKVFLGKEVPGNACVHGDNVSGMRELMAHLLDDRGARRLALVRGVLHQPDSIARETVFREELDRRGIPVDEELVIDGFFHRDPAFQAMRQLLRRRRDMDAVVAANDLSALGAMAALRAEGLGVPDQVVVTGFDNDTDSSLIWPGLTTVDQGLEQQGETAASMLIAEMTGAPARDVVVVPSKLLVRGSTSSDGRSIVSELDNAMSMAMTTASQAQLTHREALSSANRALVQCNTLEEVVAVLGTRLGGLGVNRCFMVMYEPCEEAEADAGTDAADAGDTSADTGSHSADLRRPGGCDQMARVVLSYRFGSTDRPRQELFSACQLLPESLSDELSDGVLVMIPLSLAKPDLGYVLFELIRGTAGAADLMQVDVGQALRMITATSERENEITRLNQALMARSQELRQEAEDRQRLERELAALRAQRAQG